MEEFESPTSRLARLFRKGRDNWKQRALEKQKKVRALEVKVRDLSNSREYWKKCVIEAEKKLLKENKEVRLQKKKKMN